MKIAMTLLGAAGLAGIAALIGLVWLPGESASADPQAPASDVTRDQVEAAIAAYTACAADRGLIVQSIPGEGLRLTKPLFSTPPLQDGQSSADAVAAANQVLEECRSASELDDVSAEYARKLSATVNRATVEADFAWMTECIQAHAAGSEGTSRGLVYVRYVNGLDAGLTLPVSEPGVHEACAWKFEAETGRNAPPPP